MRKAEHMRIPLKKLFWGIMTFSLAGCGVLDFGGDSERAFEFDSFILHMAPQGADSDGDGYDEDGNKIVSTEVAATYSFPDIHAGYAWIDGDTPKLTPTVNVELFEAKVPYLRWFNGQIGAGADEAHFYLGKRFTSIFEVTVGPMAAWRFDEDDWFFGVQGTFIKF